MPAIANIVILTNSETSAVQDCLSPDKYACKTVTGIAQAVSVLKEQPFDIVICETPEILNGGDIDALQNYINGYEIPLISIGDLNVDIPAQIISQNYCEKELINRINGLVRLSNMRVELTNRLETTDLYGADTGNITEPPALVKDANYLIVGTNKSFLGDILIRLGGEAHFQICRDPDLALNALYETPDVDAVILTGVGQGDSHLRLIHDIRSNTRLYNLPMLMILETDGNKEAAYVHGVSDVVMFPGEMPTLTTRANMLVRQARFRLAMLKLFRTTKPYAVSDGLTALYTYGFLMTQLDKQVADALTRDKFLSVGCLDISGLDQINRECGYAGADQLLRQVGSIIGSLVRAEDLTARHGEGRFVVTLPGTTSHEADIAMQRIAGVVKNTEFAAAYLENRISAEIRYNIIEPIEGDDARSLLARGFENSG